MLHYIQNLIQELNFTSLTDTVARLMAVILCLTVHESAHGLTAYVMGDRTAKREGRISLNPLRHIDPVGLFMIFTVGFGWAKPVPVNPRHFRKPKLGMAAVSLAGPVSNFILAALLIAICKPIYLYAEYTEISAFFFYFLMDAALLSIGLGLFNLLPIPPLDGSKILAVFLPDRLYILLMRYESFGILLLLVLSYFNVTGKLISGAITAVYDLLINLIILG